MPFVLQISCIQISERGKKFKFLITNTWKTVFIKLVFVKVSLFIHILIQKQAMKKCIAAKAKVDNTYIADQIQLIRQNVFHNLKNY